MSEQRWRVGVCGAGPTSWGGGIPSGAGQGETGRGMNFGVGAVGGTAQAEAAP